MRVLLLAAALLVAPVTSFAAKAPTTNVTRLSSSGSTKLLDGVALNATASARTLTAVTGRNWSKALIFAFLDRTAATTLDATFECSPDGTTFFARQSQSVSSGTSTLSDFTYTKTGVSADVSLYIEADIRGCQAFRMVWSGTSGGASDLLDVYVTVVAGE